MTSAFFGLGIASSALRTAQSQVDVANQNIANANTPGYSRQTATIQATTPFPTPTYSSSGIPGQVGTGVQVTAITRARNTFIDYQIRGQLTQQGEADAKTAALSQVEATINEPSTTGLSSTVTKYWAAWHEVANTPADSAVRTNLIEAGKAVADVFQSTVTQFKQQQQDLDKQVSLGVTSVNTFAGQIASLNTQISKVESSGMHANDLRDQRDLVVDQLSSLVKITTIESGDGQVSINVGNHQLVERGTVHTMQTTTSASGGFAQVQWSVATTPGTPDPVNLGGGKLQGLIDSRDTLLQERITDVNQLAGRIIDSVNSVHAAGVGLDGKSGQKFFAGTDATNMAIDPALTGINGTDKVAAARMDVDPTSPTGYSFAAGDSSNAVALSKLQDAVAQQTTTGGSLATGQAVGPSTLLGVDLSGAAANTSYTFSVTAGTPPTISVNNGTTSSPATLSVGVDSTGNQLINVDSGSLRLTLSSAAGTTLSAALTGLNGQQVTTLAGPSTMGDQYAQQVAALGVESQTAQSQSANQQVLVSSLTGQRQQVSGVSLDEETVNLMMYQKSYQAAARVISTMDSMLDTLINHTIL